MKKLFGFMSIRELVTLVAIGMLLALIVGMEYYLLEWAWADYDDHDRGIYEGMLMITTYELGAKYAKHLVNRKDLRAQRQAHRA
jgi:hypothetical protein